MRFQCFPSRGYPDLRAEQVKGTTPTWNRFGDETLHEASFQAFLLILPPFHPPLLSLSTALMTSILRSAHPAPGPTCRGLREGGHRGDAQHRAQQRGEGVREVRHVPRFARYVTRHARYVEPSGVQPSDSSRLTKNAAMQR